MTASIRSVSRSKQTRESITDTLLRDAQNALTASVQESIQESLEITLTFLLHYADGVSPRIYLKHLAEKTHILDLRSPGGSDRVHKAIPTETVAEDMRRLNGYLRKELEATIPLLSNQTRAEVSVVLYLGRVIRAERKLLSEFGAQ